MSFIQAKNRTSFASSPLFFVCMSCLWVALMTMTSGWQSAVAGEPGIFQYTAEAWMGVVSLVSDQSQDDAAGNSDDELDEEDDELDDEDDDEDDDAQAKKSGRKHRKHGAGRGSPKQGQGQAQSRHKHQQRPHGPSVEEHGRGPEREHGRGPEGRMPPPPPQDMRKVVMDRLDDVIATLSRIENQLGSREGDRRSPGDARGGPRGSSEDMHRRIPEGNQMPDGMRRMIEERMQEGRKRMEDGQRRMEEARKQFKQMQQRIEKLEAEVQQLKREKT